MNHDDRRLIADCLSGRSDAFGDLVRRYQDRLYNAVYRILGHPDDAADVVQEAFINAYQSLASFKGDAEFFTWLYRIAFNAAISLRRKRRPTISLNAGRDETGAADPQDMSEGVRPGETLERDEENAGLYVALERLSIEHRSVLVMKDIDGLKYEQIADVIGVPVGTVRSRIHRARLELRGLLSPADRSEPIPAENL